MLITIDLREWHSGMGEGKGSLTCLDSVHSISSWSGCLIHPLPSLSPHPPPVHTYSEKGCVCSGKGSPGETCSYPASPHHSDTMLGARVLWVARGSAELPLL